MLHSCRSGSKPHKTKARGGRHVVCGPCRWVMCWLAPTAGVPCRSLPPHPPSVLVTATLCWSVLESCRPGSVCLPLHLPTCHSTPTPTRTLSSLLLHASSPDCGRPWPSCLITPHPLPSGPYLDTLSPASTTFMVPSSLQLCTSPRQAVAAAAAGTALTHAITRRHS